MAFATGTSWGTFALMVPIAVPLAAALGGPLPLYLAAVLGGGVFGDHCSPISDTTIMSSMASSCDHVDHVRTQLPYALLGASIAILVGYLPAHVHGVPPWLLLLVGVAIIGLWVRFVGKPVDDDHALNGAG